MSKLQNLIAKSQTSSFNRWLLNQAVSFTVPFNSPHGFKIVEVKPGEVKVLLPYRRKNMNHVKGIHACALATLCEFATGITLLSVISESEYRIILKSLRIDYHYQAKMDVYGTFSVSQNFLESKIYQPMQSTDAIFLDLEIDIHDKNKNHICTGFVNWQVKKWNKVKLKV